MTGRPLAIEQALAEIGEMDRATLAKRWNELFSHQPPKGCKRALLERAAAYHIQASYEGKAKSPLVKKLVASKAAYNKAKQKPKKHKFELRPGARLVGNGMAFRKELMWWKRVSSGAIKLSNPSQRLLKRSQAATGQARGSLGYEPEEASSSCDLRS